LTDEFVPNPVTIYHHHKPWLKPTTIKQRPEIVGYEGNAEYLGEWADTAKMICAEIGMRFAVNPEDFQHIDIGFAARGGPHGSLMASRYKSNVKLANFYGAGIPCVMQASEVSYRETDNGKVLFFTNPDQLRLCLKQLMFHSTRFAIHCSFIMISFL